MAAIKKTITRPKGRNLLAVAAHFKKAGPIEEAKGKLPRKAKHKKLIES